MITPEKLRKTIEGMEEAIPTLINDDNPYHVGRITHYKKSIQAFKVFLKYLEAGNITLDISTRQSMFDVGVPNDKWRCLTYCYTTGRWCNKGKKAWYKSKSTEQFIEKYLFNRRDFHDETLPT